MCATPVNIVNGVKTRGHVIGKIDLKYYVNFLTLTFYVYITKTVLELKISSITCKCCNVIRFFCKFAVVASM